MFASDEETAHLLRESTRLRSAKDWDGAIACLQRAKRRMLDSPVTYPIDTWTKLARYLVAAARPEEALAELQWLLDDLPRRMAKQHHVDNPDTTRPRSEKLRDAQASMRHPKTVIEGLIKRVSR